MKSIGVRQMELVGRFPLPKEARNDTSIKQGDCVEFFTDSEYIVIKKYKERCLICGVNHGAMAFKNKLICKDCIEEIINLCDIKKDWVSPELYLL